ncbi:hypothetical protein ACFV9C_42350 [Kribbella sp. NPDC059898]|uniref:hypothetical protein n=1 Tax=Kribbella sp. NPDC059898 TaxID=3346995 RepID=UPI003665444F
MTEEACMPIKPGRYPTILGYHPERGTPPGWLVRDHGYIEYVLYEVDSDFELRLWRRPSQPAVVRDGLTPEPRNDHGDTADERPADQGD